MAYSGVFVFGDSLVDAGNALKLAQWYGGLPFTDLPEGAPTAELGYFQGRFSNGFTSPTCSSNKAIGLVTKPVFPYGFEDPWLGIPIAPWTGDPSGNNLNFAYGGAQIRQGERGRARSRRPDRRLQGRGRRAMPTPTRSASGHHRRQRRPQPGAEPAAIPLERLTAYAELLESRADS